MEMEGVLDGSVRHEASWTDATDIAYTPGSIAFLRGCGHLVSLAIDALSEMSAHVYETARGAYRDP
jgi:hypothetical protein